MEEVRMRVGPLELIPERREVLLRGEPVEVNLAEWRLLRALAEVPTRVFTHRELLEDLAYGYPEGTFPANEDELEALADVLHDELGRDGDSFVEPVWGVGYRLVGKVA